MKNKGIPYRKFNDNDYIGVRIFSRFLNFFCQCSKTVLIITFIALVIISFVLIYALCNLIIVKDVQKELKKLYNQDFIIIEDYGKEDAKTKGLYLLAPKYNKNIIFKAYNRAESLGYNDYADQSVKYYYENCENKELLDGFEIEQSYYSYEDVNDFLHYTIIAHIKSYSEIENVTEKAYKLAQYFISKDSKMPSAIVLENKSLDYHYFLMYNTQNTLEEEIYAAKYEYILKTKNNGEIPQEDFDNIFAPQELVIYINGHNIIGDNGNQVTANYNAIEKKYYINNIYATLQQIDNVEITKIDFLGKIKNIRYNNKTYKVKEKRKDSRSRNSIYLDDNLEDFFEVFNATVQYNFDNEMVYVTIN